MEWMSKRQAAEVLGVSTRAIERAVRRRQLAVQYRDSKHGQKAWFTITSLERYKQYKDARKVLGFTSAIPRKPFDSALTIGTVMPMVDINPWPRPGPDERANPIPIAERLTLSLDEAVQLSGLPRSFVIQSIQSGKLKAIKIGRTWYVKRSELSAFVRSL